MTQNQMNETISKIARRHLDLETLDARNSDDQDFSDQAVWSIRDALEAAYRAGRESAQLDRDELDEAVARAESSRYFKEQDKQDEAWIQEQRDRDDQLAAYEASETGPHDEPGAIPEDQERPAITTRAEQEA